MASPVLQFKRGQHSNVGLASFKAGEPGFTTDKYDFYIGLDATAANQKFFGSARYWLREDATNAAQVKLVDKDGTNYIGIAASNTLSGIATYRLPNTTNGSTGDFLKLKSASGGYYDLEWAPVPSGSFTIAADSGSNDTFTTGETLTFEGGEGVDTVVSNNKITFAAEAASSTNAGIASFRDEFYFTDTYKVGIVTATTTTKGISYFNSADFDLTASGEVSLEDSVIKSIKIDGGSEVTPSNHIVWIVGGTGIDVTTGIAGSITVAGENASTTTKGIASFNSTWFEVTSGQVFIKDSASGVVTAISGTSNEIEVSRSNGTVTIGLPNDVTLGGDLTINGNDIKSNGGTIALTLDNSNVTVSGALTATSSFRIGTSGVAATTFSTDNTLAANSSTIIPTQSAVKGYVDALDLTTSIAGDSGTGSVSTSQTLTVAGTTGEIETSASNQTITVGLPNTVIVGTALSAPTVKTATLQHSNGTQAATIDISGNITASQNLTISGNLYVNGSTTQVNTTTTTVEDQLLELGMVDGSAPSSDLDKDIGLLLNYYSGSAKKAAMFWDDSISRIVFADEVTESSGVLTVTANAYAAIEIEALWVNDCAGQSQVISCSGSTRKLENITIDAGTF